MSIRKSSVLFPRKSSWVGASALGAALLATTALPSMADEALADLVETVSPSVVTIIAEQDAVASFDVERYEGTVVAAHACANCNNFTFLWLFFRRIGNDDPAFGFFFFLYAAYEHAVVKRTEFH
jgi:S1-C subfamily serine protease